MKNKTIKKMLTLALASVLALSVVACGGGKEEEKAPAAEEVNTEAEAEEELYYNVEGLPFVKEPIEIEVAGVQGATTDWNSTYTVQKVEELMGIKMNCTTYADAATWSTQFATMMASDELPDLMMQIDMDKALTNDAGADGYLLDFTEYLDIMPNLAKFLDENPEFKAYHSTDDGSIYSLNNIRRNPGCMYSLYVSKADQEKYGFSVADIKTVDDFYNVLKSIKEQNPDAIPLSLQLDQGCGQRGIMVLNNAFNIDHTQLNGKFDVDESGNVVLTDIDERNQALLKYVNRLWEEKLLDNEAYIMTADEYRSRIKTDEVVFFHDWAFLQNATGAADASIYREYDQLVALTSEYQTTPVYTYWTPQTERSRVMVSATTEYPEAICRLIDYTFSDEGFYFINYGVEGETYEFVEDEFGVRDVNHDKFWDQEKYTSSAEWLTQAVQIANGMNMVKYSPVDDAVLNATDEELNKMLYEDESMKYCMAASMELAIRAQTEETGYPAACGFAYSTEEADAISQLLTDMNLLIQQYRAQFVSGDLDVESDWDAYVKEIENYWTQIQPYVQSAYERYAANL